MNRLSSPRPRAAATARRSPQSGAVRPPVVCRLLMALTACWGLLGAVAVAQERSLPPMPDDLDLPACQSFQDRQPHPAPAAALAAMIGLEEKQFPWRAGWLQNDQSSQTFLYRVAFRREVSLGTIVADTTAQEVRVLRSDAPYPGDPWTPSHWTVLSSPPRQPELRTIPLPAVVKTRAILLVDRRTEWARTSELRYLRLLSHRLYNVAPMAWAYADHEYMPPNTSFAPEPASNIPAGKGRWINTGKNGMGMISSPPVSNVDPSWFMLSWRRPQAISGIALRSNAEKIELHAFQGPAAVNPLAGAGDEWRKIREFQEQSATLGGPDKIRWIRFAEPITTRGLRITMLRTSEGPIATIRALHALVDLGDQPVPEAEIPADQKPPLRIAYAMPEAGNLTMAVNGAAGRRVRNLVTRAAQPKGTGEAPWDLKDEAGSFVAPGVYRWTALACPDLRLRYEMTVYPNVSAHAPQNSPWFNGMEGSGGWLADHTAPIGTCAAGDRVYLSAPCSESGVSLIECDLEGRKLWGHGWFAAWTGPRFLASDGKQVFAAAQVGSPPADCVWTVDMATKKINNLLTLAPTATRRGGMQGLAVDATKLYLSISGPPAWFDNAAAADDVDLDACTPRYRQKREPRYAHEVVPDQRRDFLRLFRLAPHPPGGETGFSLTYLDTMGGSRPQQHIVLAFKRPVPLGSVVLPVPQDKESRMKISVLKKGAPYPPNPAEPGDWIAFPTQAKQLWDAVPAPEGTLTRALRITFSRGSGEEDLVGNLLELNRPADESSKPSRAAPEPGQLELRTAKDAWHGRLEGMKLLRRRYANVAGEATVHFNSGKLLADGTWDAQRTRPLTEADPGIFTLQWKTEQTLRGLAIKEVDAARTKIDVFCGPPDAAIDISGSQGWQEVAEYQQQRRDMSSHGYGLGVANPAARYVDGYVDFGRPVKTRAVRLRAVEQWPDKGKAGCMGIRMDLGGGNLDSRRCRVFGVAALAYLGGEEPVDPLANERIAVYATADGKLLNEIRIEQPGQLAVAAAGHLLAVAGAKVLRVDPAGTAHRVVVSDLESPTALAVDQEGRIYVFDAGKQRQNVRVYDGAGKFLHAIGTPGGFRAGAWDPTRLGEVSSLAIDRRGRLWAVESQFWPKRITLWDAQGTFLKEFLGNTAYGGGGVLDPEDKTRLFYGPLEFALDWQSGTSRLKNLTSLDGFTAGEVPMRVGRRMYLVTRPQFMTNPCAIVYLYEKDHLKPVAALGLADRFAPLARPEVLHRLADDLVDRTFIWCDRNGDGEVQAEEVTLAPKPVGMQGLTNFNRDLSVQASNVRYVVREFLPNGVPVYEARPMPALKGQNFYRLDDGNFFELGDEKTRTKLAPDGKPLWLVPVAGGWGVNVMHHAPPFRPDQVFDEFGIAGHATAHAGGLGEFLVIHSNPGAWNIWTADGLLVGPIFRDLRDPRARPWSMTAHQRGMILEDVTVGEEHFAGYFCRTADNRYYVVAGHNHVSILEVLGLDQCRRLEGEVTVTAADVRKAQQWDVQRQHEEVYQRSPVVDVYRLRKPPKIGSVLNTWGPADAEIPEGAGLHLGYDDEYLYLACSTHSLGPLVNKGHAWDRLFKTGAAVDVQIGTDPAAQEDRQAPRLGDVRLLMTFVDGQPVAVLYRPVVPGTPPEKAWRVVSPVGETVIDEVKLVPGVRMVRSSAPDQYVLEAAVPLAELGLKPRAGLRVKFDWGILVSGAEGSEVVRRIYWANHASQTTADAPSEARLQPNLWGHARFHDYRPTAEEELGERASSKKVPKDLSEELDQSSH